MLYITVRPRITKQHTKSNKNRSAYHITAPIRVIYNFYCFYCCCCCYHGCHCTALAFHCFSAQLLAATLARFHQTKLSNRISFAFTQRKETQHGSKRVAVQVAFQFPLMLTNSFSTDTPCAGACPTSFIAYECALKRIKFNSHFPLSEWAPCLCEHVCVC